MFWSINRAHQHDIGGATHGAYNPGATEIWQEGIRITAAQALRRAACCATTCCRWSPPTCATRATSRATCGAMIGSARIGERRLLELVDEYGLETVLAAVGEILDSAERQARACIRRWKDGVFRGEAILDDDGHGISDIHIRATVTKKGDSLLVDLTDSPRPGDRLRQLVASPTRCPPSTWRSPISSIRAPPRTRARSDRSR